MARGAELHDASDQRRAAHDPTSVATSPRLADVVVWGADWEQRAALNCPQWCRTAPNRRQRPPSDLRLFVFGPVGGVGGRSLTRKRSLVQSRRLGRGLAARTRHGIVPDLDEFTFRFKRRTSRSRGLVFCRVLQLAVGHEPVRYRDLVADPKPKAVPPVAPHRPPT